MKKVLVGPPMLREVDGEFRHILHTAGYELVFPPRNAQMVEGEVLERLSGCIASLAGSEPYSRRVIEAHPQMRIIARSGVGFDAVDVAAATEHGIPVTVSPGNAEGVAEHAIGLMLALAKGLVTQHNDIVTGAWPRRSNQPLRGKTLAIVGLGRIGKQVALRAKPFRMKVMAHDIAPDLAFADQHSIALGSLDEMFALGDYVSLHIPLEPNTRHLVGRRLIELMKPSAFLINTARGGILHEGEVAESLIAGRIAGAGLDVLEHEPPAQDHPFFSLPNVVLSAHTAGVDTQSRDDMALIAARTIVAYLRGEWPGDIVVNPEVKTKL